MSEEFFEVGRYYTYKPTGDTVKLVSIEPEDANPLTFRWVNKDGSLSLSFIRKALKEEFTKLPKKPPTLYVVWVTDVDGTRYSVEATFDKKEAEGEYQACVREVNIWKGVEIVEYEQKVKE